MEVCNKPASYTNVSIGTENPYWGSKNDFPEKHRGPFIVIKLIQPGEEHLDPFLLTNSKGKSEKESQ